MQFSTSIVLAALTALVSAQANPFTFSTSTLSGGLTAGSPFNITWQPDSSGTITLLLKQGSPTSLNTVATIVANTANTGSFVWTPSTSLVQGDDYALEIVDDTNTNSVNFSGQFTISSTNTVSASTQSSTASVSSTSASSSASTTSGSSSISTITTTSSSSSSSITASSFKNSTTTAGTKTTSSGSSATSASPSQTTTIASSSGLRFKVGGSMLALVGAVMLAL